MLEERRIAVLGAGLMGHGIAQVLAAAGAIVRLHDPSPEVLASAPGRIAANLERLGADPAIAARVVLADRLADAVGDAEFVFEAAPEQLALKQDLFAALEELTPAGCVLATNSSVLRVSEIAAPLRDGGRVVAAHWWNPPYLVPLVEVAPGERSDERAVAETIALLAAAGKRPVRVARDVPGLIGNRLQHALWRQALELVDAGVCDAEAVDAVVKASFGPRLAALGPIENADLIGLDLTLQIHDYVLPTLDPPSEAAEGLRERVAAGRLGMKSGAGYRVWGAEEEAALRRRLVDHLTGAWPVASPGGER